MCEYTPTEYKVLFQSFFLWKLVMKQVVCPFLVAAIDRFQSFFLWKLVMKTFSYVSVVQMRCVSILLPLETGHEGGR